MNHRKNAAVLALRQASEHGLVLSLRDVLEATLAEWQDDLENAGEPADMWRAQGAARAVRALLDTITPRDAG